MWPQKDLIELRVIFQDLEDLGHNCYFREVNNIRIYSKRWTGENSEESGVIDYDQIYDPLVEAIDRMKDLYVVDSIYFILGLSPNSDWKSVRYDYPPDNLDTKWYPKSMGGISGSIENEMVRMLHNNPEYKLYEISIHTSPKKVIGKIKNFLGFNESLNNDISDNIKDVFEDIGDDNTNIQVKFESNFKVSWDVGYSTYRSGKEIHSLNYVQIKIDSSEFEDCNSETNKIFKKLEMFFDDEVSHRLDRLEDLYKVKTMSYGVEYFDRFALPLFYTISNNDDKYIKYAYVTRYRPFDEIGSRFSYIVFIFFGKI